MTCLASSVQRIVEGEDPESIAREVLEVRNRGITRRGTKTYPAVVRSWASREGIPLAKVQRAWDDAKGEVDDDADSPDEGTSEYYRAVMSVFKDNFEDLRTTGRSRR